MIAPGHAEIAQEELGEEGQVEADEDDHRAGSAPHLRIHPSGHARGDQIAGNSGENGEKYADVKRDAIVTKAGQENSGRPPISRG